MSKREIQTLIDEAPSSWKKMFKRYRLGTKPTVDQLISTVLEYTPSGQEYGEKGKAKFAPPAKVRKEAMKGIRLSWEHNYTSASGIGLVRAMQLVVKPKIWERSVKRMHSYFARSGKDTPKRYMAWLNWGGDSGKKWVDGIVSKHSLTNPRRRRNMRTGGGAVLMDDKRDSTIKNFMKELYAEQGISVYPTQPNDYGKRLFWIRAQIGSLPTAEIDKQVVQHWFDRYDGTLQGKQINPRRRRNSGLPPKLIAYHCGKRKPSDAWNSVRFLGRGENYLGGRAMPPNGWGIYFASSRNDRGDESMTNQEYYDHFYSWRNTTAEKMDAPYCRYAPLPYLSIVEIDTSGLMGSIVRRLSGDWFPSPAIRAKFEALKKKHSVRNMDGLWRTLGIEGTHRALKKIGITGQIGGAGHSWEISVFDPSIITDISVEPMFDQAYAEEYAEQQRLADQRYAERKAAREARRAARRAKYTQNPRRRRNGTRLVPKEQVRMVGFTKAKTKKATPHIPVVLGFIEELLGEDILFPTPIRPMTKAEFQEGRGVVDNGHPRGAGHGQYDEQLKEVAVNGNMAVDDIVANILHENLHHARPRWSEERVRDTTGQAMEYLYGFYTLGKPYAEGRLKANPRRNRSIPARYLKGYKGKELTKRKAEIQQRRSEYKKALEQYGDESSFPLATRRKLYRPFETDKGKKSKKSSYTVEANKRGFKGSISEKAKSASQYYGGKIPVSVLKTVMDRGMAAWASGGHRAGQTPHSWGMARVNSFLVGGKTFFTTDFDQVAKLPSAVSVKMASESVYAPNLNAIFSD